MLIKAHHNAGIYVNSATNAIKKTHVNKFMNKYLCGLTVLLAHIFQQS